MSGAAAVCTSAGSPQDRRARAGFASGSALATDGNAAPHAAAGEFRAGAVYLVTARSPAGRFPAGLAGEAAPGGPGVQASGMTGSQDLRSGGQGDRAAMRPRPARVLEVPPLAV